MRIATALLIVLAGLAVGHAQQLEQPPLVVPRRPEPPPPTFFPLNPPEAAAVSGWLPRTTSPSVPAQVPVPVPRSGPVCLKAVPVDPSIDSGFVKPVPDFGSRYTMRIIEAPECVTLAAQPWQQWPQPQQR